MTVQVGADQNACDLARLPRDTMHLTVYAFVPARRRFEHVAEYAFREQQAYAVIGVIDSIPALSLPAFLGTALAPGKVDAYGLIDLDGEVWFQVGDDGLIGLTLTQPTGSPELNRALLAAVVRADSLRLLTPLPKNLRGRAIDLRIGVQTAKPVGRPAIAIALGQVVFAPIQTSAKLLPGYRRPRMPANAFISQTGDTVLVDFIIDADGVPQMSTLGFRQVNWREFAEEVELSLATMRFQPARSGGCPVPQRVCQPWYFVFRQ
jgi:hypothetical protein